MSRFKDAVIDIVNAVPKGKVVSYGQVALYAGLPRLAREVGWVLQQTDRKVFLPWWRVINRHGKITIKGAPFATPELQKKLLEAEGVPVSNEMTIEIEKYRFIADETFLRKLHLPDSYITRVMGKYSL